MHAREEHKHWAAAGLMNSNLIWYGHHLELHGAVVTDGRMTPPGISAKFHELAAMHLTPTGIDAIEAAVDVVKNGRRWRR